jgi:hypothetical protein
MTGETIGAARVVSDYDTYCEGDREPYFGKTIRDLIYKRKGWIVYLDEDLSPWWATASGVMPPTHIGDVANRVSDALALSLEGWTTEQRHNFMLQLGEAYARALTTEGLDSAIDAVDKANQNWVAVTRAIAKREFLTWALCITALAATVALLTWVFRTEAVSLAGDGVFEVVFGSSVGAVGAMLSILTRLREFPIFDKGTLRDHGAAFAEAAARLGAGALGAALVAIAVKLGLLFGGIGSGKPMAQLAFACFVSGASERLIPSFLENVASKLVTPVMGPDRSPAPGPTV